MPLWGVVSQARPNQPQRGSQAIKSFRKAIKHTFCRSKNLIAVANYPLLTKLTSLTSLFKPGHSAALTWPHTTIMHLFHVQRSIMGHIYFCYVMNCTCVMYKIVYNNSSLSQTLTLPMLDCPPPPPAFEANQHDILHYILYPWLHVG